MNRKGEIPGRKFRVNKKKEERIRLEKEFLGRMLLELRAALLDAGTAAPGPVTGAYPDVTWRDFLDENHRGLWRALETFDLSKGLEARTAELIEESDPEVPAGYKDKKEYYADNPRVLKELTNRALGVDWIERELKASGALALAGGKVCLREIFAASGGDGGEKEPAAKLGFV